MKRMATLCWACIKAYKEAGYTFAPFFPLQKEPCDLCTRIGFTGVLKIETDRKNQTGSKEDGG